MVRESFAHKIAMPSNKYFKPSALSTILFIFFLVNQNASAAPGGCSSADFKLARTFEATVGNGFPFASYAVADFDGNGKPDLAETDFFGGTIVVLLNDGTGRLVVSMAYAVGTQPRAVAAADFNGDGRPDLVVANSQSNNVSILLNTGSGIFGSATNFAVGTEPGAVAVGDFNGDGKADVAVGNSGINANGSVSVLLGDGLGSFSAAPGSPITISGQTGEVAVADFNGDGKRDLAVATYTNGFFVLLGDGSGRFGSPAKVFDVSGPAVATADLNGDGKFDLALGVVNGVAVLLGNGNGGFSTPVITPHESGSNISSVAIADIDGDGKLDVAAAADSPGGVTFFKGDGTGAFSPTRNYLPAKNLSRIALGDFDSDGDLDIVAGESILINIGAGVFEAARV